MDDVVVRVAGADDVLSPSERALPFYSRAGFIVPDEAAGGDRLLVRTADRQESR